MNKQTIKEIGTINIEQLEVSSGQIEIHIPVEVVSSQLDAVIEECTADFKKKNPDIDTINYDIRLVFSFGYVNPEFELELYIFDESQNTLEIYDSIKVELSDAMTKEIKRIAWNKLGETVLGL